MTFAPPEGSPRHQLLPGGGLAIANVTRGDAGTYGLECHNREGSASARLHLRVHCGHSAPYGTL